MFTGIVEEIGKVQRITRSGEALRLVLEGKKVLEDVKLGDSIAVSGVCLTVTDYTSFSFSVDVMPETYHSTTLAELKTGSSVNLERAMGANGRFGGHFVTGHVDGTGMILRKEKKDNAVYVDIEVPPSGTVYTMLKGSIAIDGTSLTIFGIKDNVITVSLIPHTYSETVLGLKEPGAKVNIEFDMLAKYIHSFMERKNGQDKNSKVTLDLLRENGFM
ncbi:riboflavin synthase subunit alpha [Bacillus methanolicus PB1]|uniref:Riboflavin synthase n=1 Tax=Bacillus methanolicus PB1 TaxID=997296 RepID=I3DW79_BACMT|nr:riboflavin synthase [Bacillus methanolicus]EIJ78500.1 riboflavin synthase subunit alpha [Bacillus methanolicus PB1]